ncbi:hypothetical protein AtDm6_0620 [Acetobacter tropicalis]|uniref:Uncharacterized protein n=1 Tax=Acetobacter tropicalis TaxID=104102 RepID=A0A094YTT4_9PROT|nr:hypothetical protein AtDm6_0620 [Acetobacter tropicalis]
MRWAHCGVSGRSLDYLIWIKGERAEKGNHAHVQRLRSVAPLKRGG